MKNQEFTEIFKVFLRQHPEYAPILDIARRNSRGKLWIIGGFVYRPIIEHLYGKLPVEKTPVDIDFMAEKGPKGKKMYIPKEWEPLVTEFGNLALFAHDIRIDLNYIKNFHSISARRLSPNIRHFFTGTPMDIQSIAYDLTDKNVGVTGHRGVESIKRKVVRVNYLQEAKYEAAIRGVSLEELVKRKADELGFGIDLRPLTADYNHTKKRLGEILESGQKTTEKGLDVLIVGEKKDVLEDGLKKMGIIYNKDQLPKN